MARCLRRRGLLKPAGAVANIPLTLMAIHCRFRLPIAQSRPTAERPIYAVPDLVVSSSKTLMSSVLAILFPSAANSSRRSHIRHTEKQS